MPIDAMIPLMGKPMNVMSPFQVEAGAQQIQAGQNQNALSQLGIAQKQQEMQGVNALRQVLSDPSSLDPSTGQLTENALRKIYAVDPKIGQQVSSQMQAQALHKSQLEHNLMLTRQAEENIRDKKQKAMLELLPTINDITIQMNEAHDKAAAAGHPDPKQVALAKGKEVIDRLAPLGLLGGQEDEIRAGAARYDRAKADTVVASIRDQLAKQKSGEGDLYVDGQGNRFKVDKQGMVSIFREGQYHDFRGVLPKDIQPLKQPSTMLIQERAQAQAEGKAAGQETGDSQLTPDDARKLARQAWRGDKSVFQNLGRGAQGAKNIIAIRRAINQIGEEEGKTPEDLAAMNAEFAGMMAGERTLGTRQANVDMAVTEARNLIPLALKASADLKRTNIKSVNDLIQYAQGKTASPELRRLSAATNALINVYARAISPQGVPTISDKDHAREVLDKGFADGDYEAAVNQLELEINAAQKSPGQVREHMRGSITGKASESTPATPKPGDVLKGYRFKGGDPAKQESWEKAQ